MIQTSSVPIKFFTFLIPVIGFSKIPTGKNLYPKNQQANHAPSVKLINLSRSKDLQWNSVINYKITVTDKEDGVSDYGEVPANEVLMKVKFFEDSSLAKSYIKQEIKNLPDAAGLMLIKSFNCLTCHRVKTKLIGPPFDSIALKYPSTQKTFDSLVWKIIKGSKNVWGSQEMPPHPDVKREEAKLMLQWIFKNCADPDLDYLFGLDGIIRTRNRPAQHAEKAIYVLTAGYTDHGLPNQPNTKKRGQEMLIVKSSEPTK
jgi:cytochrome c551/c552